MDYLKAYEKLVIKAIDNQEYRINNRKFNYYENHHILPKACFPNFKNFKHNQVLLTPKEHFTAHHLLYKAFPETNSFAIAFFNMSGLKGYKISSVVYGNIREEVSKRLSEMYKGHEISQETREKIRNSLKGFRHSEETKKRMSISTSGDNNPKYWLGREKPQWIKDKIREKAKGENNSFYGKTHTENCKEKMSKSRSGIKNYRITEYTIYNENGIVYHIVYGGKELAKILGYKPTESNAKRIPKKYSNKGPIQLPKSGNKQFISKWVGYSITSRRLYNYNY